MKATRTNWEDMWEKYFDSYQGWIYVADCLCPPKKYQESDNIIVAPEECSTSYFFSAPDDSSLDKLYPIDDNYFISEVESGNSFSSDEIKHSHAVLQSNSDQGKDDEISARPSEEIKLEDLGFQKPDKVLCCKPTSKQPEDIIFECDTGSGFAFVTQKDESLIYTPHRICIAKTLGTISINTSCLKNPKTKILFSCNIFHKPRSDRGTSQLEFVLSRSCNNCAEIQIGNWVYNAQDRNSPLSQTFRFTFYSNNSFPGCYDYFIRAIPIYIKNSSVLITNCHIDAFAQSK